MSGFSVVFRTFLCGLMGGLIGANSLSRAQASCPAPWRLFVGTLRAESLRIVYGADSSIESAYSTLAQFAPLSR